MESNREFTPVVQKREWLVPRLIVLEKELDVVDRGKEFPKYTR